MANNSNFFIMHSLITARDFAVLGPGAAGVLDAVVEDVQRNIMFKNGKTLITADWPNANDSLIAVLHYADASNTQVADALAGKSFMIEDGPAYQLQQTENRWIIDIQSMNRPDVAGETSDTQINWKFPPKGIPILRGNGLAISMFNPGPIALLNGPTMNSVSRWMGGWF